MDLRLSVDDNVARAKSRIIALRILGLTLRLMENWRRPFSDPDNAMIMLAIAAIVGEKLTRASVDPASRIWPRQSRIRISRHAISAR